MCVVPFWLVHSIDLSKDDLCGETYLDMDDCIGELAAPGPTWADTALDVLAFIFKILLEALL